MVGPGGPGGFSGFNSTYRTCMSAENREMAALARMCHASVRRQKRESIPVVKPASLWKKRAVKKEQDKKRSAFLRPARPKLTNRDKPTEPANAVQLLYENFPFAVKTIAVVRNDDGQFEFSIQLQGTKLTGCAQSKKEAKRQMAERALEQYAPELYASLFVYKKNVASTSRGGRIAIRVDDILKNDCPLLSADELARSRIPCGANVDEPFYHPSDEVAPPSTSHVQECTSGTNFAAAQSLIASTSSAAAHNDDDDDDIQIIEDVQIVWSTTNDEASHALSSPRSSMANGSRACVPRPFVPHFAPPPLAPPALAPQQDYHAQRLAEISMSGIARRSNNDPCSTTHIKPREPVARTPPVRRRPMPVPECLVDPVINAPRPIPTDYAPATRATNYMQML